MIQWLVPTPFPGQVYPSPICQWLPVAHNCLLCQRIIFSRYKPPAWKYLEGYALPDPTRRQPEAGWWLVTQDTKTCPLSLRQDNPLVPFILSNSPWDQAEAPLQLSCLYPASLLPFAPESSPSVNHLHQNFHFRLSFQETQPKNVCCPEKVLVIHQRPCQHIPLSSFLPLALRKKHS